MKHFSVRPSLFLILLVAQLFVVSGCMDRFRAADKQVEGIDKRMKQIQKEANNVHSKRDPESSESTDE
jgi:hypothetical protein